MIILVILVTLHSLRQLPCLSLPVCEFATANKYLGTFSSDRGSGNVDPYESKLITDPILCISLCRISERCFAASFDGINTCSFYNTSDIIIVSDNQISFYLWKRCDWSLAVQPLDGRCKGMFIHYFDKALLMTMSFLVLKSMDDVSAISCYGQCLRHPLCGAVNYKCSGSNCDLLGLWPEKYQNETNILGTDLYRWTCIPDFVESVDPPKTPSQRNVMKCTGYWSVTSRTAKYPNIHVHGLYFETQSYNACLLECDGHPKCTYALFNVTYSLCSLPFTDRSDPYQLLLRLTFIEFKWICVKNDSKTPTMSRKERNYKNMKLSCVTLVKNDGVFIAKDDCGYLSSKTNFTSCRTTTRTTKWTESDQCIVNQTFWMFPSRKEKFPLNGTLEVARIFNGLTSFWMAYPNVSVIKEASFMECRRFDGSRSMRSFEEAAITSKLQWYAYPSQGQLPPYERTPKHIVITGSQKPFYSCRTKIACTSILRQLQILYFFGAGPTEKFLDIPYNFMFDENGNVYEARGWANKCASVIDHNRNTLCFAFIGRLKFKKPSIKFLKSLKRMIELAVKKGYVIKDYSLYIVQDFTKSYIYPNYANIIKNWYRYRGFIPKDCLVLKTATLVISVLMIASISLTFFIVWLWLSSPKICNKCECLHLVSFRIIYPQEAHIRPFNTEPSFNCHLDWSHCIITERDNHLTSNSYKKIVLLLKLWIFNRILQTHNSTIVNSDLGEFMKTFETNDSSVHLYEGLTVNKWASGPESIYTILCCSSAFSYRRFERMTLNRLCICHYFMVDHPSFADLEFETV